MSPEPPKQSSYHSGAIGAGRSQFSKVPFSHAAEGLNKLENGLQFVQRTAGDVHVTPRVAVSHAARALGEIEGYAIGGAPPLRSQCITLSRW